MPAPKPLTGTPPPQLDWSRPTAPAARDFDDIYFSVDGGLEESGAVFHDGCDLPERWARLRSEAGAEPGKGHAAPIHVIAELGFGTGLNFLATWQLWDGFLAQAPDAGPRRMPHLHFISIEKFPFSKNELIRAYPDRPELAERCQHLLSLWPGRVKGFHRLPISDTLSLTLIHDDVGPALDGLDARVDSWFLDGFSPAKNPDMWSPDIMARIAALSTPGTRLATFTVAGAVRQALSAAGFHVSKKPGFGRKRHRLEAVYTPVSARPERPERPERSERPSRPFPITPAQMRPIIIGGGIAGAALMRSFDRAGIDAVLIEAEPDLNTAASGNPAALVRPRFDLQDQPQSRFFLASYLYARNAYLETSLEAGSGVVLQRGITHLAKTPEAQARFAALVENAALPPEHMRLNDGGGLDMAQALVIDPKAAVQAWTQGGERIAARVMKIAKTGNAWRCLNEVGETIAEGSHIIVCAGADIKAITGVDMPPLRFSQGQLTWAKPDARVKRTLTYGGYAVPLDDHILVGATHKRLGGPDRLILDPDDDAENLNKLHEALDIRLEKSERASRRSVRVTTPDTLPVMDQLQAGLWVLTGLGSRGFVFAPLLAEALVSQWVGAPSPLDTAMISRLKIGNRLDT